MMQTDELSMESTLVAELRAAVTGVVLVPGDAAYDAARTVYFTAADFRPDVIVRAADAEDVARVVTLAREAGAGLSVRNGGHSLAAHGVRDGGIVLDVRGLSSIAIDAAGRRARAGAGLTAGEYTAAVGAHGLATGFGDAPSVGIGGITLAGGVGFLHRRHGMTIDQLIGAEVVTADGTIVRADAASHPDLFWAIRGGGGNFGVVTQLEFALQPVERVLGGMMILPATPERLVELLEQAYAAPDDLSLIVAVMPAPPMPFIPADAHGTMIMMIHLVHADIAAGERFVAQLRALATPLLDAVRPMRYPEIYHSEGDPPHPAAVALHTRFIDSLDVDAAATLFDRLRTGTAPMRVAQFRPLGGALARVSSDATAFAHRNRHFIANVGAMYQQPEQRAEHALWAAAAAAELEQSVPGAYVGFLDGSGASRIREAYPDATWDRLVRIKQQYDPTNLFDGNHNIAPDA
ncbi:MAG TPA: FAD-binding oxidoreductase [Longimicrobiales bacterium]